ncbi:hypothetical protein [Grimontia marina]|uniref:Uncharacterized protein n=1 Tax=Grimontia marina TaxID=646534 RepID=A0A128F1P5_9GAMM|nr:hypothetical protein [Grimontia marina]CZF80713.1 hypothetical protein GMA8713_01565 [Grimontia marina]
MPDFIYMIFNYFLEKREKNEQNPADWREKPSAISCSLEKSCTSKGLWRFSDSDKQKCADAYHPFVQSLGAVELWWLNFVLALSVLGAARCVPPSYSKQIHLNKA